MIWGFGGVLSLTAARTGTARCRPSSRPSGNASRGAMSSPAQRRGACCRCCIQAGVPVAPRSGSCAIRRRWGVRVVGGVSRPPNRLLGLWAALVNGSDVALWVFPDPTHQRHHRLEYHLHRIRNPTPHPPLTRRPRTHRPLQKIRLHQPHTTTHRTTPTPTNTLKPLHLVHIFQRPRDRQHRGQDRRSRRPAGGYLQPRRPLQAAAVGQGATR